MPLFSRWLDWLGVLFFRSFFRLLLVAVSVGEWVCLAEPARLAGISAPFWSLCAGSLGFFAINRALITMPQNPLPRWKRAVIRGYTALAFTSVFGFAFLVGNSVFWGVIELLTYQVSLAAGDQASLVTTLPSMGRDWSAGIGLATISLFFVYGYTFGQRRLITTRLTLPLRRATPAHEGLRIVQISDIHLGRYMAPEVLAAYVEEVNRLQPDILVITGDILDNLSVIPAGFAVLGRLHARYGVFAVLGNHDRYAGADDVATALRQLPGFTVLRDDVATVSVNGAPLYIAGVDDLGRDWARGVTHHPGLVKVQERLLNNGPVILLSHRPDLFPQAVSAQIDLVLSGHTHGGQLALPALGGRPLTIARFITRYDTGLYRDGDTFLYVNRGIGCTGQRIRLFAPREITTIELTTES